MINLLTVSIFCALPLVIIVLMIWQTVKDAPKRKRDKRAREMLDRDRGFYKNS